MKRKINFTFDKLIWAVIILLPIFTYLLTIKSCGSFENVFYNYGFGVNQSSVVYTTITDIFGAGTSENLFIVNDVAEKTKNGVTYSLKNNVLSISGLCTEEFSVTFKLKSPITFSKDVSFAFSENLIEGAVGLTTYLFTNNGYSICSVSLSNNYTSNTARVYGVCDNFRVDFQAGVDYNSSISYVFNNFFNNGYLGVFSSPAIPLYITYLVNIELLHLLVDCLLFIPRIAQKYINKGGDC